MLRTVAAVLCAFVTMVALVLAVDIGLMLWTPETFVTPEGTPQLPEPLVPWFLGNLAWSLVAAVAGGRVAAAIARERRRLAAGCLVGLMCALEVLPRLLASPEARLHIAPLWWSLGELAVGVAGVGFGLRWAESRAEATSEEASAPQDGG